MIDVLVVDSTSAMISDIMPPGCTTSRSGSHKARSNGREGWRHIWGFLAAVVEVQGSAKGTFRAYHEQGKGRDSPIGLEQSTLIVCMLILGLKAFPHRQGRVLACCAVAALSTSAVGDNMLMKPRILSIQSTVSHGYVGNKAAVFPLQCMGFNVDSINTVSLSNHPNYSGGFKGQFLAQDDMRAIVEGLESNNLMHYDVVMNGYTRSIELLEEIAKTVKKVQETNPEAIYVCDPVLGDNDAYYVPETLLEVYKRHLLPLAFAVTPNYFEVEALTGVKVRSFEDAEKACGILHDFGVKVCILTGQRLSGADGPQSIIFSVKLDGASPFILRSDVKTIPGYYYGCGDLFSAFTTSGLYRVLLEHNSSNGNGLGLVSLMAEVLELSTWAMDSVLMETHRLNMKELRIIESIDIYRLIAKHWGKLGSTKSIGSSDSGSLGKNCVGNVVFNPPAAIEGTSSAPITRSYLASSEPDKVMAVIVDMDGTLTEAGAIDFAAMYERNGFKRDQGNILEVIENLPDEDSRKRAMKIVIEEEVKGCDEMVLRPDLHGFVKTVKNSRIRLALSTRNSGPALKHFLAGAGFDEDTFVPALHRDSLGKVNKPDPEVAHHIMREWGLTGASPDEKQVVWFLGDSIDDMSCGKAAGCKTCLIRTPFNQKVQSRDDIVDLVVDSLSEWCALVGLVVQK